MWTIWPAISSATMNLTICHKFYSRRYLQSRILVLYTMPEPWSILGNCLYHIDLKLFKIWWFLWIISHERSIACKNGFNSTETSILSFVIGLWKESTIIFQQQFSNTLFQALWIFQILINLSPLLMHIYILNLPGHIWRKQQYGLHWSYSNRFL